FRPLPGEGAELLPCKTHSAHAAIAVSTMLRTLILTKLAAASASFQSAQSSTSMTARRCKIYARARSSSRARQRCRYFERRVRNRYIRAFSKADPKKIADYP